jgi:hypothetical protein
MIIYLDRKLTMNIDSKLKLENLSTDELYNLRSFFTNITSVLDRLATDFENLHLLDGITDEVVDARTKASEVISRAKT